MKTTTLAVFAAMLLTTACDTKPEPGETVCYEAGYAGGYAKQCRTNDGTGDHGGDTSIQSQTPPSAQFSVMPSGENAADPEQSSIELWAGQTPTPELLGSTCDISFSDAIYGVARGSTTATLTDQGDIIFEQGTVWLSIASDQLALGIEVTLSCPLGKDIGTGEPIVWTAHHDVILRPGQVENLSLSSFEATPPNAAGFN